MTKQETLQAIQTLREFFEFYNDVLDQRAARLEQMQSHKE